MPSKLAQRMKVARLNHRLSQTQLAQILAVSNSLISHWESGRRSPSAYHLGSLCASLGVSADWLLDLRSCDTCAGRGMVRCEDCKGRGRV